MEICGWKLLWTIDGIENVLQEWLHGIGRTFDFRVHGPSSRPVVTLSFLILVFFFFSFFNLKLPNIYNAFFLLCNTIEY